MARFILDIRDELDIPMIMVEHDMGLVMDLADRVLVSSTSASRSPPARPRSVQQPRRDQAYLGEEHRLRGDVMTDRAPSAIGTGPPTIATRVGPGRRSAPDHGRDAGEGLRHLAGGHLGAVLGHVARRSGTPCSRSASSPATGSRSTRRTAASGCTPTWPRSRSGRDRRALPDQPAAEVGYLLVALRREGAGRRGPGAGRQGAGVLDELPGPRADRLPRAARHPLPLRRPEAAVLGGLPRARRASTAADHPDAVDRADGRGQAEDVA